MKSKKILKFDKKRKNKTILEKLKQKHNKKKYELNFIII